MNAPCRDKDPGSQLNLQEVSGSVESYWRPYMDADGMNAMVEWTTQRATRAATQTELIRAC